MKQIEKKVEEFKKKTDIKNYPDWVDKDSLLRTEAYKDNKRYISEYPESDHELDRNKIVDWLTKALQDTREEARKEVLMAMEDDAFVEKVQFILWQIDRGYASFVDLDKLTKNK